MAKCAGCHVTGKTGVSKGKLDMSMKATAYTNLVAVMAHLKATNVPIVKGPYAFGNTRAIMIEDLDGLGLELIEMP